MAKEARIIIIEDNTDLAEAMRVCLESRNHQVRIATTPEDGLKGIKEETPDLIILDVMFGPDKRTEGFNLAQQLKLDPGLSSIPILMVTAVNAEYPNFKFSPETDGEFLPVDDFVNKPIEPVELLQKVEKLLEAKISKWAKWPHKRDQ
jgi:DNA-binding response OmpR family regulator